jgi:hypothetical protein
VHGRVDKSKCIDACQEAHALLYLLEPNEENMGRVSSKLYDYFASQRPIISVVPKNSLSELKLTNHSPAMTVPVPLNWADDVEYYQRLLKKAMMKLYYAHKTERLSELIMSDPPDAYSCNSSERIWIETISDLIEGAKK